MGVTDDAGTTTRRAILTGAGAAGVAATLAACGKSDSGGSGGGGSTGGSTGGAPTGAPPTTGGGGVTLKTADVPVNGGKILKDKDIVVTQPAAGQFRAFTATCTHAGCQVAAVSDGTINCDCHGSRYSIQDGSVKHSAPGLTPETQRPLARKNVTVSGDTITVA
jgi:Rieske Fe-S protein